MDTRLGMSPAKRNTIGPPEVDPVSSPALG